jgi:recombination protein RecR
LNESPAMITLLLKASERFITLEYPKSIQRLIHEFAKLPGIGKRSAERFVFHLLKLGEEEVRSFADAISGLKSSVSACEICGNLDNSSPCYICRDDKRDRRTVCVIEDVRDLYAMEKTGQFKGTYHILGGAISPLDGVGPEKLRIRELIDRIKASDIKEVIVATGSNVPGDATSLYLNKILKPFGISVSRIAFGMPVGSELQNVDENTLIRALEGRRNLD